MAIDRTTQRNHLSSKAKEKILDEGKRFRRLRLSEFLVEMRFGGGEIL